MKIGDKILCIKDIIPIHIKGNTYNIIKIYSDEIQISNSNNKYTFFILSKDQQYEYHSFYTYFITLKQLRKEKLKKLQLRNETTLPHI